MFQNLLLLPTKYEVTKKIDFIIDVSKPYEDTDKSYLLTEIKSIVNANDHINNFIKDNKLNKLYGKLIKNLKTSTIDDDGNAHV